MTRRPEDGAPPVIRKVGLGYQMVLEDIGTTLTLSRVRKRSDGFHGYMTVKTTALDIKTIDNTGILMAGALHIDGPKVRNDFSKALQSRTPGFDIDWPAYIDHLAHHINVKEQLGEPIVEIGDVVVPRTAGAWAWEPFVPKTGTCLFYGPGGSGKSRFALAGLLSVQMGREILPGCAPALKGNTLYLDWETDRDTVAERIQMICAGLRQPPVKISYRRCVRPLADDAEELGAYITSKEIVFLVVDSAAAAIGKQGEYGDANEGALKLFEALRILNIPTILVDHISKQEMKMSGKVRGALPYGSIYKVNMARAAWEVRPAEAPAIDEESAHVSSFHHTKANDTRLRPSFALRADFNEERVTFAKYDGPLSDEEMPSVGPIGPRIENLLRGSKPMTAPEIADYLGTKQDSTRDALSRGAKSGRLHRNDETGEWTLVSSNVVPFKGRDET